LLLDELRFDHCITHSKEFVVAVARVYGGSFMAIARSYGDIRIGVTDRELDAFHLIVKTMVRDILSVLGPNLVAKADGAFDVVFALCST